MSSKLTATLGWITLIAILAALWVLFGEDPSKEIGTRGAKLFPQLSGQLSDAQRIRLTQGSQSTQLVKNGDSWEIAELDNFKADIRKVNAFLSGLAQSERRTPKTSNFENMDKLGLGSEAIEILVDAANQPLAKLKIGREGTRRNGVALTYALKENDSRAWVVSALSKSDSDPRFWMQNPILDLEPADIALLAMGGAVLNRTAAGAELMLQDLADGETAKPSWQLNAPVQAAAGLSAVDVAAISNPATPPLRTLTLAGFDGLAVDIELYARSSRDGSEEATWVRVTASFDAGFVVVNPAATGATEVVSDRDPEAVATAINARTSGWLFQLSDADAKTLMQSRQDLLAAPDTAATE